MVFADKYERVYTEEEAKGYKGKLYPIDPVTVIREYLMTEFEKTWSETEIDDYTDIGLLYTEFDTMDGELIDMQITADLIGNKIAFEYPTAGKKYVMGFDGEDALTKWIYESVDFDYLYGEAVDIWEDNFDEDYYFEQKENNRG